MVEEKNRQLNQQRKTHREKGNLACLLCSQHDRNHEKNYGGLQEGGSQCEIVNNFDSSGTLKTQIQNGAECDIFISAAPKQMNQLDVQNTTDNKNKLDFVLEGTRINLLENKVVLAVPAKS